MNIKKFNEIFMFGGEPMSKFYWLMAKNPLPGQSKFTIGEYKNDEDEYPWEIIGSDEPYTDNRIKQHFDVMEEIIFPNKR